LTPTEIPTGNCYNKYGSTNPIEQRMMRGFLGALDRVLDGLAPTRVLEIGVGEGEVLARVRERFPDVPLVGVDLPDEALADRWRSAELTTMFCDATALPFPDSSFDLVLAVEVLEHIANPGRALDELARVGTGTLIASVPFEPVWRIGNMVRGRYLSDLGNTPGHVNHWTRWSFRRFLAGRFHIDQVASPLPWTMIRASRF